MVQADMERLKTKLIQAAQDESPDDWFKGRRSFAYHLLSQFFPEISLKSLTDEDIDRGAY